MSNGLQDTGVEYPHWAQDEREAISLGITIAELQERRKLARTAEKVLGPESEDTDLQKARALVAKKEKELADLEAERLAVTQQWVSFRKRGEDIEKRKTTGEYLIGCAEQARADYAHTINLILNHQHPQPHFNEYPNGVLEIGRLMAGAKEVLALVPAWREALAAEAAALEKERAEFAKIHSISE